MERSFEAFDEGDWEALESFWDPDGEMVGPAAWPESGRIPGWPAILAQFKRLKDPWSFSRIEVISHRSAGDHVWTHFRWITRGKASGMANEVEMWMVAEFRGDRFSRAAYFLDREAADEALREEAR